MNVNRYFLMKWNAAFALPWAGAKSSSVSFRAFDTDTKKWVLLAAFEWMYDARQFPTL